MGPSDITEKRLRGWGGDDIYNEALALCARGAVLRSDWDPSTSVVSGEIMQPNGWPLKSSFVLRDDGYIDSKCPCAFHQNLGRVCKHVIAIGALQMLRRTDPAREENYRRERRAAMRAETNPDASIRRASAGTPTKLRIDWSKDPDRLYREFRDGAVTVAVGFVGPDGAVRLAPEIPHQEALALSPSADAVLSVLEDAAEGRLGAISQLTPADFLNVLSLTVRSEPVAAGIRADFSESDGSYRLHPVAAIPGRPADDPCQDVRFFVHGNVGFALADGRFHRLDRVLAGPFQSVYETPETISRREMPAFLRDQLPILKKLCGIELSPSEDMFQFLPDTPRFTIRVSGSRASLAAEIFARYGSVEVRCLADNGVDVCRPDEDDLLVYHVRNRLEENDAAGMLLHYGFVRRDLDPGRPRFELADPTGVLRFLGSGLPYLHRIGWRYELSAKLEELMDSVTVVMPQVKVADAPNGDFDVRISYMAGSIEIPAADVQRALNLNSPTVRVGDALALIDVESIASMKDVFADCSRQGGAAGGAFRVGRIYAPFIRNSIRALDGVDLDESAARSWREDAAQRTPDRDAKYEPVPLGELEPTLRPYQKTGVYWMRFLERSGICGLLADEMGLGKTLQTLAWLSLERSAPAARGKPALIVCPTSLVENWNREAARFTPNLKRLVVSGPNRADHFDEIDGADLVITSYALIQRDLETAYLGREFSAMVLDEAQHIKNRTTRNAKAVKSVRAVQKLVLTGTPVENSVSDVWSIFDFLMPGYLGPYDSFRLTTEEPIAAGGKSAAEAQLKLRRKLEPFILRRLKTEVAKDLPPKIVNVRYCRMTDEQQRVYNETLAAAKMRLAGPEGRSGFAKARFEILAILMRLRQISCHLGMLKDYTPESEEAELSGKLEAFLEFLDEASGEGHRILVFSQFVKMLTILRAELDRRGVGYCYLDGSTQNRLDECSRFNADRSIPLFLISLHAGGTGLTLTGADTVVHFDPWWNPAVEDQATDRAHRIGQRKTVQVVKLIAENSIEERVLALQKKKQAVIGATVGTTDGQVMERLTYDDVSQLLGI